MTEFEPKIVGFLCNWCSYAGADLAGVSRYQYPPEIRIIRVMCSARVDPMIVLTLFKEGADGIMIGGCHIGDCHYISGNYHTEKRAFVIRRLMEKAGLEVDRFRLEWISASEGERFASTVAEFTEKIKELGPSKVMEDSDLASRVGAAVDTSLDFRIRALLGHEVGMIEDGNVYGEKKTEDEMREIIDAAIEDEFRRSLILEITSSKPASAKELSQVTKLPTDRIVEHIATLRQKNLLAVDHIEGMTPYYVALRVGGD
ncbi:MAG: hydrogenase iron-sulfur subunit [Methanobacteriota archaeon]|nr:MAG: hydrogenase iron-sulfur subunit [Euryarchaeota archaeon]